MSVFLNSEKQVEYLSIFDDLDEISKEVHEFKISCIWQSFIYLSLGICFFIAALILTIQTSNKSFLALYCMAGSTIFSIFLSFSGNLAIDAIECILLERDIKIVRKRYNL